VNLRMTSTRRIALFFILLSSGISILWGFTLAHNSPGGMADFKAVYYGARCLIHHSDPYKESDFLGVFKSEGGEFPSDPTMSRLFRRAVPVCINLPTSLFIVAPLSWLTWGPAHLVWMVAVAGGLTFAAFLMWSLARSYSPRVSLFLICIVLANSEILLASGNTAGIAVSLCVVAVWCFLKERFVSAGVLCLAVSLAIKPHDAGLVWLFFLMAGGVRRKRALQTLLVAFALSLPAILWVSQVAPNWMQELHANLQATSAHGDLNDPGPASVISRNANTIIDLQSVISIFWDDPRIYNPISYLLCGVPLLLLLVCTLRSPFSPDRAWFGIAAIAALSMLPVYHRQYDAKLLLLAVPACAILWAEGGPIRWLALLVNGLGAVLTGDIPSTSLIIFRNNLNVGTTGIFGKILTVVLMRPAPLILLTTGIFYLWVYMRRTVPDKGSGRNGPEDLASAAGQATREVVLLRHA
jgi:hypothetical protein